MYSQLSFFQRFAVRRATHLTQPVATDISLFSLPKNSVFHYAPDNALPPNETELAFKNYRSPIYTNHVLELDIVLGTPQTKIVTASNMVNDFFRLHHRFRKMRSISEISKNDTLLGVENYSYANIRYKYPKTNKLSAYQEWYNRNHTVFLKIREMYDLNPDRQHFIFMEIPKIIPARSVLVSAELEMTATRSAQLKTSEAFWIFETFKWLGVNRMTSMFNLFSKKHLDKINFIYTESGSFFVVNLGMINSWRKSTDAEANVDASSVVEHGLTPKQIQDRYLKLLMSIQSHRSIASADVTAEANSGDVIDDDTSGVHQNLAAAKALTGKTPTPDITAVEKEAIADDVDTSHSDAHEPNSSWKDFDVSPEFEKELEADLSRLEELVVSFDARHQKLQEVRQRVMGAMTTAEQKALEIIDDAEPDSVTDDIPAEEVILPAGEYLHVDTAIPEFNGYDSPEAGVVKKCEKMAERGLLTPAEVRRYQQLAILYKTLPAPGSDKTMEEFINITQEELKISDNIVIRDQPTIPDKTMLQSSLLDFDSRYINEIMHRDIASMVLSTQNAGLAVTDYTVERLEDVTGAFDHINVKVTPVEGMSTSLNIKIPVIDDDGIFVINGVKYRLKKQENSIPIRKTGPNEVALCSYYGKTFISRSDKKVNSRERWINNKIISLGMDNATDKITNFRPSMVFDNKFKAPAVYCNIAKELRSFNVKFSYFVNGDRLDVHASMLFDHRKRVANVDEIFMGKIKVDAIEKKTGMLVCGVTENSGLILVDKNSFFYHYIFDTDKLNRIGCIEDILKKDDETIDEAWDTPVEFLQIKVSNKTIPIGFVMAYLFGLSNLMDMLKLKPRRVPNRARLHLSPYEYAIRFNDETLIFPKGNVYASLFMAGFKEYKNAIKSYSVYLFDKPAVYQNVIEESGGNIRLMREIDNMESMFVDPITKSLLIEMKEPTTFPGLIMRAAEMLMTVYHEDLNDGALDRIRGYERIAAAVYSEVVRSIKMHNSRPGKARSQLDLNPYAVWKNITSDSSIMLVNEINPVQNLKEQEAVTLGGTMGRSSRTLTVVDRMYHVNDMGTISEATVDSADVGYNIATPADPKFTNLRGMTSRFDMENPNATQLFSTSALLAPVSDRDDTKRVLFGGIQQSHVVACDSYRPCPVRTGYEQVVSHRTSDLFAKTAKKAGKVISVDARGILVEYEDGTRKGYELGRRFGKAAGLIIPHDVVTNLAAGQSFEAGDVLCYNTGFFEQDYFNSKNVVMKNSLLATVVLWEAPSTLEDSCSISRRLAAALQTKTTKEKNIVVTFEQTIHQLLKPGTPVESDTILCIIEDAITANNDLFDSESLDTLKAVAANRPLAKVSGVVDNIEVYYHGDKEDMSESLRAIADQADRELAKRRKAIGATVVTGQVGDNFRIDGDPLPIDSMVIRINLTSNNPAGVGDKGVFGNQLKTVIGEVMDKDLVTEDGTIIDAQFGQQSTGARIINNADIVGTTVILIEAAQAEACNLYFG